MKILKRIAIIFSLFFLFSCANEDSIDSADSDKDGLTDMLEAKLGTDPNNSDTDGDMLLDGTEDYNKNGKRENNETNPLKKDSDGDRLKDGTEDKNHNGIYESNETNPLDNDSDDDGTDDGDEDEDGDGEDDGDEDGEDDGD